MRIIKQIFGLIHYLCTVMGSTFLLLVLGHFAIAGMLALKTLTDSSHPGNAESGDSRELLPVYDAFPGSKQLWKELRQSMAVDEKPYYLWKRKPFEGRYVNVSSEGIRQTVGSKESKDKQKVFVLGGSTTWGTGVQDSDTIPSQLQSLFGKGYAVSNFGETGFVSTQELNYLLYQLAEENIPDIVIFYDGVNDGYAGAYSPAVPRFPASIRFVEKEQAKQPVWLQLASSTNYAHLIDYLNKGNSTNSDPWDRSVADKITINAATVVDVYESHIRQVKALANAYGFKAYFFWQPNLFSQSRKVLDYERRFIEQASPVLVKSQYHVYLEAKKQFSGRENEGIFFLGNALDDVNEAIYIDDCHLSPSGNEVIAEIIFESIEKAIVAQ